MGALLKPSRSYDSFEVLRKTVMSQMRFMIPAMTKGSTSFPELSFAEMLMCIPLPGLSFMGFGEKSA